MGSVKGPEKVPDFSGTSTSRCPRGLKTDDPEDGITSSGSSRMGLSVRLAFDY